MSDKGWIAVDLDSTLAHYDCWHGIEHIGAPVPAMVERVKGWLAEGKDVRIFTARVCTNTAQRSFDEAMRARAVITDWCREHIGVALTVTNVKDFGMAELWDDRCIQVEKNTGQPAQFNTPPCPACGDGALCIIRQNDVPVGIGCFVCGAAFVQTTAKLDARSAGGPASDEEAERLR